MNDRFGHLLVRVLNRGAPHLLRNLLAIKKIRVVLLQAPKKGRFWSSGKNRLRHLIEDPPELNLLEETL